MKKNGTFLITILFLSFFFLLACGPGDHKGPGGRNSPHGPLNPKAAELLRKAKERSLNEYRNAEVGLLYQEALKVQLPDSNYWGEAVVHFRIAEYYKSFDDKKSFAAFNRAFSLCNKYGYDSLMLELYAYHAMLPMYNNNESNQDWQKADSLARLNKMHKRRAELFFQRGYRETDQYLQRDYLDSAAGILVSAGEKKKAAEIYAMAGEFAENKMRNINVAAQHFELAVQLYRELKDTMGLRSLLPRLGFLQGGQRVYGEAWKNMREGIALLEKQKDWRSAAEERMKLALVYENSSQPDSALAELRRASRSWLSADDQGLYMDCMNDALRVCARFKLKDQGLAVQGEAEEYESTHRNISWEHRLKFLRKSEEFFRAMEDEKNAKKYDDAADDYDKKLKEAGIQ